MALTGRIDDMGLADLLQLLINTHKTGTTTLQREGEAIRFQIRDGWILHVLSDSRPIDARLGSRLVRAGQLSHMQFGQALRQRANTGKSVGLILYEEGLLSQEHISRYANLEAMDVLLSLFTWTHGQYRFEDGPIPEALPWVDPINADYLLIQGFGLVHDLPDIRAQIPSRMHMVALRRPLPRRMPQELNPEALFLEGSVGAAPMEEEFAEQDRDVHALCSPGVEVQAVVDRSPVGYYETFRSLSRLISGGFIELSDPSDITLH